MREFKVMKFGTVGAALAAAVLVFGGASPASAAFKISLDDGSGPITVEDNMAGDTDATAGIIVFNGSIGSWSVNVVTGLSKPVLGPVGSIIDLNSINVTSSGPGTLAIRITDTDFDLGAGDRLFVSNVGGTTAGSVSFDTYFDAANAEFGMPAPPLANLGPFGAGAFSGSAIGAVTTSGAFSLTAEVMVYHTSSTLPQVTSFDGEIRIPEPATLGMLGFGLIALGAFLRRRKGAQ